MQDVIMFCVFIMIEISRNLFRKYCQIISDNKQKTSQVKKITSLINYNELFNYIYYAAKIICHYGLFITS